MWMSKKMCWCIWVNVEQNHFQLIPNWVAISLHLTMFSPVEIEKQSKLKRFDWVCLFIRLHSNSRWVFNVCQKKIDTTFFALTKIKSEINNIDSAHTHTRAFIATIGVWVQAALPQSFKLICFEIDWLLH